MKRILAVAACLSLSIIGGTVRAESEAVTSARTQIQAKNWDGARTGLKTYIAQNPNAVDLPAAKALAADCLRSIGEDIVAQADARLQPGEQKAAHDQRYAGELLLAEYRQEGLAVLADDRLTTPDREALGLAVGASLEGMINRSLVLLDRANALPKAEDAARSKGLRDEWLAWDKQYRAEAMELIGDARLGEIPRTRLKNRIRWGLFHLYNTSDYLAKASEATTVTEHPEMAKALREEAHSAIALFQRDAKPILDAKLFPANIMDRLKRRYLLGYARLEEWSELETFAGGFSEEFPKGSVQWALGRLNVAIAMTKRPQPDWSGAAAIMDELIACKTLAGDKEDHLMAETALWRVFSARQMKDEAKASEVVAWAKSQLAESPQKDYLIKNFGGESAGKQPPAEPPRSEP